MCLEYRWSRMESSMATPLPISCASSYRSSPETDMNSLMTGYHTLICSGHSHLEMQAECTFLKRNLTVRDFPSMTVSPALVMKAKPRSNVLLVEDIAINMRVRNSYKIVLCLLFWILMNLIKKSNEYPHSIGWRHCITTR